MSEVRAAPDARVRTLLRDLAIGATLAAGATAGRAGLGLLAPGLLPFVLIFPAILIASLLAGWRAGAFCCALAFVAAWLLFFRPTGRFLPLTTGDAINLVLAALAAASIVLVCELYRRSRDRLTQAAAEGDRRIAAQLRLLDNATSFMAVLNGPEFRIAYANRAYQRLMRWGPDVIGRPYLEVRPNASPEIFSVLRGVLRTGQPHAAQSVALEIGPGEIRYVDYIFEPILDANGHVEGVFVEGADVTEVALAREEAEAAAARLRQATEAGGVGIWEWQLETGRMTYSPQAKAISGFDPDEEITYEKVVSITHPDDYPRTSGQAQRALDPVLRETVDYEYRIIRPDGEVRWVTARGQATFEMRGGVETAVRYAGTLIDITERKLAEQAIAASQQQLSLALNAGRMAVWQVDSEGRLAPSPALNLLIGLPEDASPTIAELEPNYLPGELDRIRQVAAESRLRGDRFFEVEYRYRLPNDEVRWFNARAETLDTAEGQPGGVIGVVLDVTERKLAEERLHLLTREVDHRANNLMSVVQGIVALSRADAAHDLRSLIAGRVQALARAHQLLSESRWRGADLRRLVEEELLAYAMGEEERVLWSGPDLAVNPAAAQAIAMALHELATNAVKHGALSRPGGRVSVDWDVEAGHLRLAWEENGGPAVTPPTRRGLGTSVLERSLSGPLGGQVQLDWRTSGLVCEMKLPLATARDEPEPLLNPSAAAG